MFPVQAEDTVKVTEMHTLQLAFIQIKHRTFLPQSGQTRLNNTEKFILPFGFVHIQNMINKNKASTLRHNSTNTNIPSNTTQPEHTH